MLMLLCVHFGEGRKERTARTARDDASSSTVLLPALFFFLLPVQRAQTFVRKNCSDAAPSLPNHFNLFSPKSVRSQTLIRSDVLSIPFALPVLPFLPSNHNPLVSSIDFHIPSLHAL